MSELTKDTIINDRYVLIEHKGSGSFGEVWLAQDKILNQQIALKIYISLDPRGVEEFKAEYNLAIGLSHPNLLTANYLDVWEQRPFLVMKYCANGSSAKLAGKIHEDTLIRFIHDVAAGLHYLHDQPDPIIHQDIKPDNILVDQDGMFLITDFGISKKIRSTMRKLSSRSIGAGATAYMGPERFDSNPTPVKASDIWSLGVSIYEMGTGELPFSGMGGGMQRNGAAMPSLNDSWSPEVNQLMQACLAEETWDRPTAAQLEEYTADLLAGKKPMPTWRNIHTSSGYTSQQETHQNESPDTDSNNIVFDFKDPRNIDLKHYKQLKNITNFIYITFGYLLGMTGLLGYIGVNKYMYTTETIGIGFLNCFILLTLGLSAITAIKKHKPNAIFKTKLFFGSTLFYWFVISFVAYSLPLFKFIMVAICIKGFRMITSSIEVEELFPKNSRHFSLKDFLSLLLAILLPIVVEFTPYFLGELMNDQEPQPVKTEVTQPKQKTTEKNTTEEKTENSVKERAVPEQEEAEELIIIEPKQTNDSPTDDAARLKIALRKKDYQTVQRLANKSYTPAYVPLAKFYLEKNDYDDANRYAQKARKAGQPGAREIIQILKNLGYYD